MCAHVCYLTLLYNNLLITSVRLLYVALNGHNGQPELSQFFM